MVLYRPNQRLSQLHQAEGLGLGQALRRPWSTFRFCMAGSICMSQRRCGVTRGRVLVRITDVWID